MFSLFRKKKTELTTEQIKLNKLWDMYASGELEQKNKDTYVLCDYESGVNGEGHSGFFFNNEEDLPDYKSVLKNVLPTDMYTNFLKAYQSYNSDNEEEICEAADDYFYQYEQKVIAILQEYANGLD